MENEPLFFTPYENYHGEVVPAIWRSGKVSAAGRRQRADEDAVS